MPAFFPDSTYHKNHTTCTKYIQRMSDRQGSNKDQVGLLRAQTDVNNLAGLMRYSPPYFGFDVATIEAKQ